MLPLDPTLGILSDHPKTLGNSDSLWIFPQKDGMVGAHSLQTRENSASSLLPPSHSLSPPPPLLGGLYQLSPELNPLGRNPRGVTGHCPWCTYWGPGRSQQLSGCHGILKKLPRTWRMWHQNLKKNWQKTPHLLTTRYIRGCARNPLYVILNPYNNLVHIIVPYNRWEHWDSKRLSNSPRPRSPLSGWPRTEDKQSSLLPGQTKRDHGADCFSNCGL